ncbi:unnamed protein product (macronuclear) [Paramecium tetraurelia]|uniref:Uncharacterized protein n=1 Tax=Paramecium tetraurelia TaxID=5888 RepID=A0DFV4_PARTE|nr:uncharacterized protein GSPATT00039483001 [Paramecium tetraurelia]CAK81921.1 unnamed protein product [Paramecium tetraurelia]|eukprot:XP_001449318.1 hypothetical protein (macronuclear) [Paramecium tetraurelia strain d4-2]
MNYVSLNETQFTGPGQSNPTSCGQESNFVNCQCKEGYNAFLVMISQMDDFEEIFSKKRLEFLRIALIYYLQKSQTTFNFCQKRSCFMIIKFLAKTKDQKIKISLSLSTETLIMKSSKFQLNAKLSFKDPSTISTSEQGKIC